MQRKSLTYYQALHYPIIVESIEIEGDARFLAYSRELGKYACYGLGHSEVGAIEAFLTEKNNFIEQLYHAGKAIPVPKAETHASYSGFFNVRTSPVIHAQLVAQAKEQGVSLNLYLNQLLAAAAKKEEVLSVMSGMLSKLCGKADNNLYKVSHHLDYILHEPDEMDKSTREKFDDSHLAIAS